MGETIKKATVILDSLQGGDFCTILAFEEAGREVPETGNSEAGNKNRNFAKNKFDQVVKVMGLVGKDTSNETSKH